jgi:8-oxo-dGTP pyrophosphatase MutT (NUDIX family)
MPFKFVFPGGRVDPGDLAAPDLGLLAPDCITAMSRDVPSGAPSPHAITACALRELTEETGLHLIARRMGALRLVFRAITPMGRPRRFDARFFLADLADMTGDSTHFSGASSELSQLHWITLQGARVGFALYHRGGLGRGYRVDCRSAPKWRAVFRQFGSNAALWQAVITHHPQTCAPATADAELDL